MENTVTAETLDKGYQSLNSDDPVQTGTTQLVNGDLHLNWETQKKEKISGLSNMVNGPIPSPGDIKMPNGDIADHEINDESEEDDSPTRNPDSDESKKDADTSKAVTFADELEVYDISQDASQPRTISLQTPVHLIDPHSSSVYSNQEETQNSDSDIFSLQDKALEATDKEESLEAESQSVEDSSDEKRCTAAQRPSVLSLAKSSTKSEESVKEEKQTPTEESEDHDAELKVVQIEDGTGHKEFTVQSVKESELLKDHEEDNVKLTTGIKNSPHTELHPLYDKALSCHSDGVSHSTDSNNWDTIGPLDNPAFLKTLQYSVSQPFDQDEHFGIHSNLDLRSLNALQDAPDLDGGWAWVVLIAAFVASSLLGATVYAAGVLMSGILAEIDPDLTKASWVGSVNVCAMCISGPFVGTALRRFGARKTVFCAGIVVVLGFIGASLSTTITQLIFTHGLIAGVGAGYTVNPLFVSVGQYFNRYRGLACGLLATGAGAGMLAGGSIISALLDAYGLSGTYLIWAGVIAHIAPVGLLLRPSPEERLRNLEEEIIYAESQQELNSQPDLGSVHNSMLSGLNSLFGSVNQSMLSGMDRISQRRKSPGPKSLNKLNNLDSDAPLLKTVPHYDISRSSYSVATNATTRSHPRSYLASPALHNKPTRSPSHGGQPLASLSTSPAETPTATSPLTVPSLSQYTLSNNLSSSPHVGHAHHLSTSTLTPANATPSFAPSSPTSTRGPLGRFHRNRHSMGSQSQYTSMSHISRRLSFRGSLHPSHTGELDNESVTSTLVSQLRPRDALAPRHPLGSRSISTLMGSVASFPTALAIVKDDLSRYEGYSTPGSPKKTLKDCGIRILDSLRLLRNRPFLVFIFTCFLWAFGESPVMIYLPSYAISRGTSPMQASFLYTAMGIGSILGRFLSGLIATDSSIGPIILHTGCLGVAGILIIISPLITATVVQQMIFSCLVGIYTGSLVPLTSLITIEMLGLGELGLGFGFISMSQGVGYLIGPPLSSVIVRAIGYKNSFVFSGIVLLTGSLVAMCIAFLLKNTGEDYEDEQEQHSLVDLEKALQRIADSDSEEDVDHGVPGDNVKALAGSVNTLNEIKGIQSGSQTEGALTEGSGEITKYAEHHTGEDKLDPIMEVVGK